MKKIFLIFILFFICILIYISKEKNNDFNIKIDINNNEVGLLFIKTDTSNHILYKKNSINILIHLDGDKDIKDVLTKLNENKINYNISFKDSLDRYDIKNSNDKLYIKAVY